MDKEEFIFEAKLAFKSLFTDAEKDILDKIHDKSGLSYDELYTVMEQCVEKGKKSIRYFEGAAMHYSKSGSLMQKQIEGTRNNEKNVTDTAFNMMRQNKVPITLNISEEVYAYFEKAGKEMGVTTEAAINLFLCSSVAKKQKA